MGCRYLSLSSPSATTGWELSPSYVHWWQIESLPQSSRSPVHHHEAFNNPEAQKSCSHFTDGKTESMAGKLQGRSPVLSRLQPHCLQVAVILKFAQPPGC